MAHAALAGLISTLREATEIFRALSKIEGPRSNSLLLAQQLESFADEMRSMQAQQLSIDPDNFQRVAYDLEACVLQYLSRVASLGLRGWVCFGWLNCGIFNGAFGFEKDFSRLAQDVRIASENPMTAEDSFAISYNDTHRWGRKDLFLPRQGTVYFGSENHPETLANKLVPPSDPGDADLQANGEAVISIVGMAGIGKTRLAWEVYHSVLRHFDCSAVICASENPNKHEILQDVAKQVGLEEEEEEEEELLLQEEDLEAKLGMYLADKRYLILLDDLWNSEPWDYLATVMAHNRNTGSRIITTSRKTGVLGGCVSSFQYELQPLDDDASYDLFHSIARRLVLCYEEGDNIGITHKRVRKLGGLPLAVATEATVLRSSRKSKEYLSQLAIGSTSSDVDECSRAVFLSYKDLPKPVHSCLLYFGLFPEDYCFSASSLINQWIAERFLEDPSPEDEGESYLKLLQNNSLIEVCTWRYDGRINTFRVHDSVRTFCILMSVRINFFQRSDVWLSETHYRYAICKFDDLLHLGNGSLRSAVCSLEKMNGIVPRADAEQFLHCCKMLRLLQVASIHLPSFLTKAIGNVKLLQYLGTTDDRWPLRQVSIPSTIGKLKRLEILDLRSVECGTIPDSIWTVKSLKHILLRKPSLYRLSRADKVNAKRRKTKVNLPNLQTLYVVPGQVLQPKMLLTSTKLRKLGISFPTNTDTEAVKQVINLDHLFQSLEILWLSCGSVSTLNLARYGGVCRLHLRIFTFSDTKLPLNLVKLVLVMEILVTDPLSELKQLKKLQILKLYAEKSRSDEIVCSGGDKAFPELRVLELYFPFSVRKLKVEECAMPKLKKISGLSSRMVLEVPDRIRALCLRRKH